MGVARMNEIERNRECAKKILEKHSYRIEIDLLEGADSKIVAGREVVQDGQNARFYVMCAPPYDRFEQWEETRKINEKSMRSQIRTLNRDLRECIKTTTLT